MIILIVAVVCGMFTPFVLAGYFPFNIYLTGIILASCIAWWYSVLNHSQALYADYKTALMNSKTMKEKRLTILDKLFMEVDIFKDFEKDVLIELAESTPMTSWLHERYPKQIETAGLLKIAFEELKNIEHNINSLVQRIDQLIAQMFKMSSDPFFKLCVHPDVRKLLDKDEYFSKSLNTDGNSSL